MFLYRSRGYQVDLDLLLDYQTGKGENKIAVVISPAEPMELEPPCKAQKTQHTARGPDYKQVSVTLFGSDRSIGVFQKSLVTDLLTVIEDARRGVVGRGRRIQLHQDRLATVSAALAEPEAQSAFRSVEEIAVTLAAWRETYRDNWEAGVHYDGRRAQEYTTQNATAQRRLTEHALELMGAQLSRGSLALDLGCGTGLSSEQLQQEGAFVIGTDLSPSMLEHRVRPGMDVVLADMGQRLPFRAGVADAVQSIGALHYLLDDCSQTSRSGVERCTALCESIQRCTKEGAPPAVLQFIPRCTLGFEFELSC